MSDELLRLIKPEDPALSVDETGLDIGRYLFEGYRNGSGQWLRNLYYEVRPLISDDLLLALRKPFAVIQSLSRFPAWPIEPVIVGEVEAYLRRAIETSIPHEILRMGFWPGRHTFALVLSHDIESEAGFANALSLVDIEEEFGLTSSFYIVPERYPIHWDVIAELKRRGCEIGVQGLKHDGKLFKSRQIFEERAKKINSYAAEWGAVGFRSPSTLRKAEWMSDLRFDYDSSFPDTDPFEPQPGGCCSIWPFFIGDLVELPMTLPQDHTLFDVLQRRDISIWTRKADWIAEKGGMVLIDTHPDYLSTRGRQDLYRRFLERMLKKPGAWHAQTRDVARWWRERELSLLNRVNGRLFIRGPAAGRGSVVRTKVSGGGLVNDFYSPP